MPFTAQSFFNSDDFMPHGHCFLWQPNILWLHVLSDAAIAVAYFSIPVVLLYILKKRKDLPFGFVCVLFALFILLCGLTHLISIWTLWHPDYALEGIVKALTALASITTFFATWRLIPVILTIPTPSALINLNNKLQDAAMFAAIVESSEDAIISKSLDGIIQTWNKGAEHLFGYKDSEAIGQHINLIIPSSHRHEDADILRHIKAGKALAQMETRRQTKDGRQIDVSVTVSPVYRDGKIVAASKVIHNITERKRAERALKSSEERYDLAMRGMSVGVWDWNIAENKIYCSKKIIDLLGISGSRYELTFDDFVLRLHPEDKDETLKRVQDHLQSQTPYIMEYRLKREDGSYIWLHATGQAIWDEKGQPTRMVGSISDITQRKADELHIKEDAARMTAIMNTVLDGLITIDERGAIQSFNPAAERIFGYISDEVTGKNIKMLMPEPYHTAHDGYLKNYLTTGEKKVIGIGREVTAQRKDGSILPIELGVNKVEIPGTRMFVGTIRDISQRKQSERDILQYVAALKRSNQELDDFAYIASHDLKEPLRGLSNNAIFLREDLGETINENGTKRLNRMTFLCERMEKLVNDLLYFSRLGRQDLAVQKTDLNETIHDITSMMETLLEEKNAKITMTTPLPTIICDMPRVTEAFRNLITNGIKYNDKPEKRIEIGCETQNGERVFFVRDNGIGIPSEFYNDVFRIFKRLNNEDDATKGTGVGLTFVKKIIERHNGRIWIESEMTKGSVFYFTIPEPLETT